MGSIRIPIGSDRIRRDLTVGLVDLGFVQTINKKSLTITERIHYLLDEVYFLVNEHTPSTREKGVRLDKFTNEMKKIFIDLLNENQIRSVNRGGAGARGA
jgi:hypothetical protein